MKKYGIVTHYDVHNHGALLQLNAMVNVLKQFKIDAKALQFNKNYDFIGHKLESKYRISLKSIGIYSKFIIDRGIKSVWYNYRKRTILNRFKNKNDLIGNYYSEIPTLDGVIIGSDEVFALHTGPTPVFWGHCLPTDNIIAYAGCFGPTTIEDICNLHCQSLIYSGLKSMKGISVRDANSADIVEKLIGKRPSVVVDPVLLYGYENEKHNLIPPLEKGYLLIYAYDSRMNSPEEVKSIKAYAKSKGLKTISAVFFHSWCDFNINVDPVNLLSYFKYADEVVTDTFHGSIMSMITEVKFAVKIRESNKFKLSSLLQEYDLVHRIFTDWKDLEEIMAPEIDYMQVRNKIELKRSESMKILTSMLEVIQI